MKLVGAKKPNEVVSWGFDFGEIEKESDGYCLPATTWRNQKLNMHITGEDGELADILAHFPELVIEGEYRDEYDRGSVYQTEQEFESSRNDEEDFEEDEGDEDEANDGNPGGERQVPVISLSLSIGRTEEIVQIAARVRNGQKEPGCLSGLCPPTVRKRLRLNIGKNRPAPASSRINPSHCNILPPAFSYY